MHFFVFFVVAAVLRECRFARLCAYGGVCALCAGDCGVAAITHALRALLRQSRRHRTKGAG